MGEVITIGLDIAKSVFQVHRVDGVDAVVIRKRIGRAKILEFFADLPPCLVGIEDCPSAHHWSRELQALGHTVKLMPLRWPTRLPAWPGLEGQGFLFGKAVPANEVINVLAKLKSKV